MLGEADMDILCSPVYDKTIISENCSCCSQTDSKRRKPWSRTVLSQQFPEILESFLQDTVMNDLSSQPEGEVQYSNCFMGNRDWTGNSNNNAAMIKAASHSSSSPTMGGSQSAIKQLGDGNSCSNQVTTANSQRLKEAVEVLLYCYRERGVSVRSEELRNLVEIFICQVFDTRRNSHGSLSSSSSSTARVSSPTLQSTVSPSIPTSSTSATSSKNDNGDQSLHGDSLSCPVCYGILMEPVTIQCGHSYCKKCLRKETVGCPCRRCKHLLTTTDVSKTCNNVLIGSLVEKWWDKDVKATSLRSEGNILFENKQVEQSLAKYSQALDLVAEDHLSLGNRSHALLTAGRSEEAVQDAEAATKSCATWPKGYFRKSAALISLGRYEEAFLSLTVCIYLIRATSTSKDDPALTQVINEMAKILHKIFLQSASVGSTLKRHASEQLQFSPYPCGKKLCGKGERRRTFSNWNDSEYNSSGDESENRRQFQNHSQQYHSSIKSSRIHDNMDSHQKLSPGAEQLSIRINRLFGRASQDLKSFQLRIKNMSKSVRPVDPSLISVNDLECSLCYRLLFQPVSTGCGHTFCRSCLERCLDHNPACPLCKQSLESYLANRDHAINEFIDVAIRLFLPKEYQERLDQHLEELNAVSLEGKQLDSDIPIFVCTMAFPTIPCPLHVFEPRYRLMIRRCMENGTNKFGMCCYVSEEEHNYGEIGTLLEIKDIQYFADGRSVVDTVGCRRFKVIRKTVVDGYNAAKIELIHDRPVLEAEIPVVQDLHNKVFKEATEWLQSISQVRRQRIHSHFGLMPPPEDNWLGSPDGPSWTWWLLAILPLDSKAQLSILSMCSLQKRFECILKVLTFVKSRMNTIGE